MDNGLANGTPFIQQLQNDMVDDSYNYNQFQGFENINHTLTTINTE